MGTVGIEKYELGEVLFEAPPSTFFKGKHTLLEHRVLVRRLDLDPARAEDARETFLREQRLAAKLDHPYIERPFDVFEHDGYMWSVHEYWWFEVTSDLVAERGPLSLADAARLGSQVGEALAHMHLHGHVHGRITPQRVAMDQRRDARLLSVVKAADLSAGIWPLRPAVLGLSPLSAPEEFAGEKPTWKSDLFGLAAAVFWWLTGTWPRGGADEREAIRNAREHAPLLELEGLRDEVPEGLAERLEMALAADPDRRHGGIGALSAVLRETYRSQVADVPAGFEVGERLVAHIDGDRRELEIEARLGAGTFGVVLRASDVVSGREYAIKALKPLYRDDEETRTRFRREADALGMVDHDNVVRIRARDEVGGTLYAVMDFVKGPDLGALLLAQGRLDYERVAKLGAGIARGLAATHAQDIVHRDLKPHNVLLARDGRAVITDFGVAHHVDWKRLTLPSDRSGTPRYMAPEQYRHSTSGFAGDLFALGLILYELLTGASPFPEGAAYSEGEQPPPLPDEVPEAMRTLIDELLRWEPEDRPRFAREVAERLEKIAGIPSGAPRL